MRSRLGSAATRRIFTIEAMIHIDGGAGFCYISTYHDLTMFDSVSRILDRRAIASGAKAHTHFEPLAARLKPCPDTRQGFLQTAKPVGFNRSIY